MKKIFRMALVFALAGATLMYTGCTKDYSEEINGLGSDVATLNSSLQALQQDLNSLKSSVSALESANTAAKAAIDANTADIASLKKSVAANADAIDGLKKEIVEINNAIEAKADAKEVEAAINQLKKETESAIAALQKDINALKKQVGDNAEAIAKLQSAQEGIDKAYAALSNELKSLVFVPQLYYAGIEAVEYNVLGGKALDRIVKATGNESLTSDEQAPAKFKAGTTIDFAYNPEKLFALGEIAEAEYNLNPSSFDIADAEDWILNGKNYDYKVISGADALSQASVAGTAAWKPVVAGDVTAENGVATVPFTIENAVELPGILTDKIVPVMNLTAELEDKDIASDYEAIVAIANEFKSIAFKATNKWVTVEECECVNATNKELYWNAKDAVENVYSVDVTYNTGKKNLKELLSVHMVKDCYTEGSPEIEVQIPDLEEQYGIKVSFELVEYTLGENVTPENAYGRIEGDYFFPRYYDNNAKASVDCGEGTEEGISAVGRKPIVLVKISKDNKVLVGQFFKINIVKDPVIDEIPDPIILPLEPFKPALPFICADTTLTTTWNQFTYDILETLGMDYKEFQQTYAPGVDVANTYILNADGEYVASTKFGTVVYNADTNGDGINDAFAWTISNTAAKAIQDNGGTASVYKKFIYGNQVLYIQLTASVAPAAKADFGGNKIKNEWFDDIRVFPIDAAEANTAHMNVYVPTADKLSPVKGGDVTVFTRDLKHYFVGYSPLVALAEESQALYGDLIDSDDLAYSFKFSATQPKINGVQLVASTDGLSLSAKNEVIATIEGSSVTYSNASEVAKELLNLWGHKETDQNKMHYANIHVDITYGPCAIKAGEADFHLRFIRPLDAEFGTAKIAKDGVVDGANVSVASIFDEITDWNLVPVIEKNEDGTFAAHIEKTIDMFAYYQFKNVKLDLSKTKVNNWNMKSDDPEKDFAYAYNQPDGTDGIKNEMKLSVGWIDNGEFKSSSYFDPETKVFTYDFTTGTVDQFNTYVINYRNDEARIDAFTMLIPATFEYAWGSYEGTLTIIVGETN